ncbi:MAG: hypothetical protein ACM3QZ_02295 [Solirubrobacterales bacterium]
MHISFVDLQTMLVRRHQTFVEMYEISAQELALLEHGQKTDFDLELLTLQGKRQDLMSEVDGINDWIADTAETEWTGAERAEIDGILRKTLTIAAGIAKNDEAANQILERDFQELKRKLTDVENDRRARNAYGQGSVPNGTEEPFFFDRKR